MLNAKIGRKNIMDFRTSFMFLRRKKCIFFFFFRRNFENFENFLGDYTDTRIKRLHAEAYHKSSLVYICFANVDFQLNELSSSNLLYLSTINRNKEYRF